MDKTETYFRDQLSAAARRFSDLADTIAENKQYDPVPFLRASGRRYKFASENGHDADSFWLRVDDPKTCWPPIERYSSSPMDSVHRIVAGAPITPRQLRCAGVFCIVWFALDVFWFVSTLNHWFGL